jgi:DNA-directed RNA polymerase II subunit RPB1
MSGHPFAFSSAPLRRVDAVQFGILSPDEIVRVKKIEIFFCLIIVNQLNHF